MFILLNLIFFYHSCSKKIPLENSKIKTEIIENKMKVEVYDFQENNDRFSRKKETQDVEIGLLKYTETVKSFFCEICCKLYAFKSYLEKQHLIQHHNDIVHPTAMLSLR